MHGNDYYRRLLFIYNPHLKFSQPINQRWVDGENKLLPCFDLHLLIYANFSLRQSLCLCKSLPPSVSMSSSVFFYPFAYQPSENDNKKAAQAPTRSIQCSKIIIITQYFQNDQLMTIIRSSTGHCESILSHIMSISYYESSENTS